MLSEKALATLTGGLPVEIVSGCREAVIADLTEDSRTVTPGCLFIARAGARADGRRFVDDAIRAGAAAVLADARIDVPASVALLISDDVAGAGAAIAERFFDSPSRQLQLIGITGTNGKTTTTYLVQQLLHAAGVKCGLIGTVQVDDGAAREVAHLTTPPAIELSRIIRRMVDNGCGVCVMEASSHALHQQRTAGLAVRIGVFTNLTGDHLDYHPSMDEYLAAKSMLFERLPSACDGGVAVINSDDPSSDAIIARTQARILRCSEHDSTAECRATMHRQSLTHTEATFRGPWGSWDVNLPLLGAHNVMNALQALTVAHACGASAQLLQQGIEGCSAPPGRLEPVAAGEQPFAVLVDYAHTDDALDNVLRALRPIVGAQGKLRVVFGCGGDRDRTKRPRMASVACRFADDVIVTSDNPRTENPQSIIDEIRTGLPPERLAGTLSLVDREAAIREAIRRGRDGDVILIAGKGHEDYQIVGTTRKSFDDRRVAAAALRERFTKQRPTFAAEAGGAR